MKTEIGLIVNRVKVGLRHVYVDSVPGEADTACHAGGKGTARVSRR